MRQNFNLTVSFPLKVCITPDFINELMRHGTGIEVLEPQSLREAMKKRIEEMRTLYYKKESHETQDLEIYGL